MSKMTEKFVEALNSAADKFEQNPKTATRAKWARNLAKNEAVCKHLAVECRLDGMEVARSRENLKRLSNMAVAMQSGDLNALDKGFAKFVEFLGAHGERDTFTLKNVQTIMEHATDTQATYLRTALEVCGALKGRTRKTDDAPSTMVIDRDHKLIKALLAL